MKTEKQQRIAAAAFAKRWEGRGYEKGESQTFWIELLTEIFGVESPSVFITFEQQAQLDHTSFIDGMIPSTHVMIEQKSLGKDLRQAIKQSDGSLLTPFQQAQRYSAALPYSQRPRWIVTCNFAEFDVYDMENPKGEPTEGLGEGILSPAVSCRTAGHPSATGDGGVDEGGRDSGQALRCLCRAI